MFPVDLLATLQQASYPVILAPNAGLIVDCARALHTHMPGSRFSLSTLELTLQGGIRVQGWTFRQAQKQARGRVIDWLWSPVAPPKAVEAVIRPCFTGWDQTHPHLPHRWFSAPLEPAPDA